MMRNVLWEGGGKMNEWLGLMTTHSFLAIMPREKKHGFFRLDDAGSRWHDSLFMSNLSKSRLSSHRDRATAEAHALS
jgi:hypothetical protein